MIYGNRFFATVIRSDYKHMPKSRRGNVYKFNHMFLFSSPVNFSIHSVPSICILSEWFCSRSNSTDHHLRVNTSNKRPTNFLPNCMCEFVARFSIFSAEKNFLVRNTFPNKLWPIPLKFQLKFQFKF